MHKMKVTPETAGFWVILLLTLTGPAVQAGDGQNWYRGQLHAHTYWSDGRGFPEQAVDAYKQRGYDFLSLTEHNRFAEDPNFWREVVKDEGSWPPNVSQSMFDTYVQEVGKDLVETKTNGSITSVRLKTYSEVKAKFEEPGKFILLPGVELTQKLNGLDVHLNYINLPLVLPCIKGASFNKRIKEPNTTSALVALNASDVEHAANELNEPYILILNHPFWIYYDIVPQNLIDCPEIRFFEVCNSGAEYAPYPEASAYTLEKFWDVVNAFRLLEGQPLLYGIGTDDAHMYDAGRIDGPNGVGDAWVMVHSVSLTPEDLIAAMRRGDFYATSGVILEKVAFSRADNTLRVKVKAEQGVNYRVRFITTKRDFDRNVIEVAIPAEKNRPARTVPVYSDDIGRTIKTVVGIEAAYQLQADDLYVRALVESDRPSKFARHFHPKMETAWTQPYTTGPHKE